MRTLAAILRFVRFPLVWTALGDALAGAAVAAGTPGAMPLDAVAPVLVISPALYLFGMGMNDLVDLGDDRRLGRDRPLARGELSVGPAASVLVVLLGVMMIAAAFVAHHETLVVAAVTLGAVAAYNGAAKRWTATAVLVMAACRAGNVLIGWTAVVGTWRIDLSPRAATGWALLISVGALAGTASLTSALEKRHGLKRFLGLTPSRIVLGCLLLLPVAGSVCVAAAWKMSPWSLVWLAAVPLVLLTSAAVRRLRGPALTAKEGQ